MAIKRPTPKEIIVNLRKVEVLICNGIHQPHKWGDYLRTKGKNS